MTTTCPRARVVLEARRLHQAAVTADLDGVGAGLPCPTVDDGVDHGGACSYGSLGFTPFVPCEKLRKYPVGACKVSAMSFAGIILILEWCRCLSCSGSVPPF